MAERNMSYNLIADEKFPPRFDKGMKDLYVKEEQTANFNVEFSGNPKPTVKWTKDGEELGIDDLHIQSVVEKDDSVTLTIYKATKDDMGTYTCNISNSEGLSCSAGKLKVSEFMASPEFTLKLKDKEVDEGMDVEFVAKFTGSPQPTGRWTFDGQKLPIDGQHMEQKYEDDYSTLKLIIHNATKEDAGRYGCVISSTVGSETCTARLIVTMAPAFTKFLKDVEAEEGAPLKLNVKFDGHPDPSISWKKDEKLLKIDGKKYKTVMEKDNTVSLLIEKVKQEDAGKYSCEIKNSQGSASSSNKVTVSGRPIIKKPLINKHAFENDTNVEIMVAATGTPAPEIKWILNGQEVQNGDNFILSKEENKGIYEYKLTIKKYDTKTTGELKFEASNESGKVETKANLYLLQKPVFVKKLKDVFLNEEEPLKLEVTVSGIPTPEVTWHFGSRQQEIRPEAGRLITGKNNKHMLLFEESDFLDGGVYVCKAINRVGEASQTITVTVKPKEGTQIPIFETHLCDQKAFVGDAVTMEVKITAIPDPVVVWLRGDAELKESNNVIIKKDEENMTYSLTLKDLKERDSSKYSCKAKNKYGEAKETAELIVECKKLSRIKHSFY